MYDSIVRQYSFLEANEVGTVYDLYAVVTERDAVCSCLAAILFTVCE